MRFFALLCAAFLTFFSLPALAEGPYVGGNYTELEYSDGDDDGVEFDPGAAYLRFGVEPNANIGIEVRSGMGLSDDTRNNTTLEQDSFYGGYLTLGAPLEAARPYLIAGYSKSRFTVTTDAFVGSNSDTKTRDDGSVGAGIDISLSNTLALNVEYMRYIDRDDLELDGLSLGFRSDF